LWTMSLVRRVFDTHDVSAAGSTPVIMWVVFIIVTHLYKLLSVTLALMKADTISETSDCNSILGSTKLIGREDFTVFSRHERNFKLY
jgi:hypothetical protein